MLQIHENGMYCGEDFFFTLPSFPWFCLSLKKGLFYLACATCVSKTATYNVAQVQLHYHKHLLWFLMSFVDHDYFFLGSARNALVFSRRGVLEVFEDYHFSPCPPGGGLLSASAEVHVSVKHTSVCFSTFFLWWIFVLSLLTDFSV